MSLVNQVSSLPTRKMLAVAISGLVVAAAQALMEQFAPGVATSELYTTLDQFVQFGVMFITGYAVKENA